MIRSLLGALGYELGILDAAANRAGLRGLNWGGWAGGPLLAGLALLLGGRPQATRLLATLPLALPLQIGLSALTRRGLNPKLRLLPGTYADRRIERLDLPGAYGPIPALHVTPQNGAQAAVCVAHGSGCDKTFYVWRLVDALIEAGVAVLLVDLDGHGESPRPQAFPAIVECVAGPARWLRGQYVQVGLLGMSLGGAVTARAVADGAPCDALVLWEVPAQLRLDTQAYRHVQRSEALRLARPALLHLFRDGTAFHVLRAWQTTGIRASIGTWDLFAALDLLGSLQHLEAQANRPPLLLVYAGRDAVVPRAEAAKVARATAGWATYRLLPRATHLSLPIEPATIDLSVSWLVQLLCREA